MRLSSTDLEKVLGHSESNEKRALSSHTAKS